MFTLGDIKQRNGETGHSWFDPATMRLFKSRVSSIVFPGSYRGKRGVYFVSSESPNGFPRYTVRFSNRSGQIQTVGAFQEHTTLKIALVKARSYANASWKGTK